MSVRSDETRPPAESRDPAFPPEDDGAEDAEPRAVPGESSEAPAGAAEDAPPGAEAGAVPESAAELRDRWLRAEAELQNVRRRATRDREESWRAAEEGVLLELISVLDDLERGLEAAREAGAPESWASGVRLTADRVRERLSRYGVTIIDPRGQPFDPRFHEALMEIEAPAGVPPGAVAQVVLRGYARGDRPLRAARVTVARPPAGGAA